MSPAPEGGLGADAFGCADLDSLALADGWGRFSRAGARPEGVGVRPLCVRRAGLGCRPRGRARRVVMSASNMP